VDHGSGARLLLTPGAGGARATVCGVGVVEVGVASCEQRETVAGARVGTVKRCSQTLFSKIVYVR
jgi:hypothetical protein